MGRMGKAVIIGFANLYSMPYAKKYMDKLDSQGILYDMIFWDRENVNESAENYYIYKNEMNSSINVLFKLKAFFAYKKFVLNILKENNYDKAIILYSLPAVLLRRYLKKYFSENYIFVYTDYTFENNPIYKSWIKTVVNNARFTTVTSKGFLRYLPKSNNILMSHNVADLEIRNQKKNRMDKKIVISYIGLLRQYNHIKKFVMKFKNDSRFILNYYGNGFCEEKLRELVIRQELDNVFVHGKYNPDKKSELICGCDIINNCFANDKFQRYAMTNRFYDAVYHLKPQITNEGSYNQDVVESNRLGMAVNINDEMLADRIYKWYSEIDKFEFIKSCEDYTKLVRADEKELETRIIGYLKD